MGAVSLALMPKSERFMVGGTEHRVVLTPTAPLPVGGRVLRVLSDSIQRATISVEEVMSIYLSMGGNELAVLAQTGLKHTRS